MIIVLLISVASGLASNVLFTESFEDSNFSSRGWYDTTGGVIDKSVYKVGKGSYYCSFSIGGTNCSGGDPRRKKFTASNEIFVSFWIRFSPNWTGSNRTYHPHIIYLMTNLSGDYTGMYGSYTTAYIEENKNRWRIGLQDGLNINDSYRGVNLCDSNENRAAHGCNGICDLNSWEYVDCYNAGPDWVNGRWATVGTVMPGTWHFVEAYLKMNTILGGKGQKDGIFRLTVDSSQLINYTDIIYRTNQHPLMQWDKIIIGPYIGDGSPVSQQVWIDELTVSNFTPAGVAPSPPAGLRIGNP